MQKVKFTWYLPIRSNVLLFAFALRVDALQNDWDYGDTTVENLWEIPRTLGKFEIYLRTFQDSWEGEITSKKLQKFLKGSQNGKDSCWNVTTTSGMFRYLLPETIKKIRTLLGSSENCREDKWKDGILRELSKKFRELKSFKNCREDSRTA